MKDPFLFNGTLPILCQCGHQNPGHTSPGDLVIIGAVYLLGIHHGNSSAKHTASGYQMMFSYNYINPGIRKFFHPLTIGYACIGCDYQMRSNHIHPPSCDRSIELCLIPELQKPVRAL
jgi:hypothetical protein